MTTQPRRCRGDAGFTLPELLMTIAILALVMAPLAAVYFVSVHDTIGVGDRIIHTHDMQMSAALFSRDVQSAQTVVTPANSEIVNGIRVTSKELAFRGVAFADALHGWAVGDGGTIVRTDDGGFTWDTETSGTSAQLNGIDVVANTDANKTVMAFAVGNGGIVLKRTLDKNGDGLEWFQVSVPGVTADLRAVSIKKAEGDITKVKVMVAGASGTVSMSTNAGSAWTARNAPGGPSLRAVAYKADDNGKNSWIVGDGGYLARGCEGAGCGGVKWTTFSAAGSSNLTGISMLSGGKNGVVVGAGGRILGVSKATDGDPNKVTFKTGTATGAPDLAGVALADENDGWAVGALSDGTSNIYTCTATCTTAASTWDATDDGTSEILRGVATRDRFHAWAVGDNVTITTATISDWAEEANAGQDLFALRANATTKMWAVGANGKFLFHNTSWNAFGLPTSTELRDISFKDEADVKKGLIVGANGTLLRTENANNGSGGTWTAPTVFVFPAAQLRGVDAQDDNAGAAVGLSGTIIRCTNACFKTTGTWASVALASPLNAVDFYDISFENKDKALAVGSDGTILVTTNGGASWTQQATPSDLPPGTTLYGVYLKDKDNAVVVGSGGVVLRCDHPAGVDCDTTNASTTRWVLDETPTGADLRGLNYRSDTAQWAAGVDGTVLFYDGTSWTQDDTGSGLDLYGIAGFTGPGPCTATAPCVWAVGEGGTILSKQNTTPALWSAQQLDQLLYTVAPVCSGGQGASTDTYVGSFAFTDSSGDTSATYVLRTAEGERRLVRQLCTRGAGRDASDPFDDSETEVPVAHFVATQDKNGVAIPDPTLVNPCPGTTLTLSWCITITGGEKGDGNKKQDDFFTYTLTGTRRSP
jgi:prepilin-type N-terminal cleavage/methylation domain-containing protein